MSKFEELLGYITATWDGPIYLTGDINIDILCPSNSNCKKYMNVLNQFDLKQIVNKPTRVTKDTASLIDHIIVSHPELVKFNDILSCNDISDHDGPYAFFNVHMPRYEPRFKMIRDEKSLDSRAFIEDVSRMPFSLVYAVSDPNKKIEHFQYSPP